MLLRGYPKRTEGSNKSKNETFKLVAKTVSNAGWGM